MAVLQVVEKLDSVCGHHEESTSVNMFSNRSYAPAPVPVPIQPLACTVNRSGGSGGDSRGNVGRYTALVSKPAERGGHRRPQLSRLGPGPRISQTGKGTARSSREGVGAVPQESQQSLVGSPAEKGGPKLPSRRPILSRGGTAPPLNPVHHHHSRSNSLPSVGSRAVRIEEALQTVSIPTQYSQPYPPATPNPTQHTGSDHTQIADPRVASGSSETSPGQDVGPSGGFTLSGGQSSFYLAIADLTRRLHEIGAAPRDITLASWLPNSQALHSISSRLDDPTNILPNPFLCWGASEVRTSPNDQDLSSGCDNDPGDSHATRKITETVCCRER